MQVLPVTLMASLSLPRLRFAWLVVMVGLSATLSLNYVLPLLNTPAGEYTPFHTHLLIGGSAAGRAWLLTHHQHGVIAPHVDQSAVTTPADGDNPTITNGGNSLTDLASLAGGALLTPLEWPSAEFPLALWALALPAALLYLAWRATPPDRPPRPA
jgi:hypothetical protein